MAMIPNDTNEIVIYGPAKAKAGLKKVIESIKHYKPQLVGVFPADYITENQMVAWMREFFLSSGKA